MSIMPSLLQLKYLDKPCSPPSILQRLTLATFLILLLHAWHLHTYPVSESSGFWSVSCLPCPVSVPVFQHLNSTIPSRKKARDSLLCIRCFALQSTGAVSCRVLHRVILTSHIILSLISYLGSTGVFEWSDMPIPPVPRLCTHIENVAAQAQTRFVFDTACTH